MAARILEAKAVITGELRPPDFFEKILRKLDGVFAKMRALDRLSGKVGASLDRVGPSLDGVTRSLGSAAARIDRAARSLERAAAETRRGGGAGPGVSGRGRYGGHGRGGHGWAPAIEHAGTALGVRHALKATGGSMPFVGGALTAAGAVAVGEGAIYVAEKSAERQHERVRMDIAGLSASEREEAEARAAQLAAKYAQVDQTSIMHTLRNARSITGSYSEASEIADDIIRTRIVAQAARPGEDVEGDFDKLLKGLEQFGVTQDPKKFREAMQRVQKVLAVEGDTLTADSIYQSFKYTRQALPGTSPRFMLGTAPALAQEMGGSSFGNALSSFNRAIVTGRMDARALKTALDLGLIDKKDVEFEKGHPTRVKPLTEGGHGFHEWRTAASDPDLWIWNTLSAALRDHQITDPAEISQVANTLFSSRTAGDLVGKIMTQRARIEKNQTNLANAPDDPAARIVASDPLAGWQGVKNAFDNLAAAIPISGAGVTGALGTVATAINDSAARLQGVQTDHQRLLENRAKYGIDDDRDFSKAPIDDLVEAKRKALEADDAKVVAKRLELAGLRDKLAQDRQEKGAVGSFFSWDDAGFKDRANALEAEIRDLETASARLRELGEAYERYKRALADDPAHHLINQAGGAAIPGFGHAAFPLGSSFGHIDPSTGRGWGVPATPSSGPSTAAGATLQNRIVAAIGGNPFGTLMGGKAGPIQAELKGAADINVKLNVQPSSDLLKIVADAKATSTSNLRMNVGTSAPGTSPRGRTPSGQ